MQLRQSASAFSTLSPVVPAPVADAVAGLLSVSLCRVQGSTYSIQCAYPRSSQASGCGYVLVSTDTVGNKTGRIERNRSEGVSVEVADIAAYSDLVAYGLEGGGRSVRANMSHIPPCSPGE